MKVLSGYTVKKTSAYLAAALIILAALILSFRPLKLWKQDYSFGVSSDTEVTDKAGVGFEIYDAGEYFVAKLGHLRSIDFYIPSWNELYDFSFRLYELSDPASPKLVYIQDISAPGNTENVHLGGEWRYSAAGEAPDAGEKYPYVSPYTSKEKENFYRTDTPLWVRVFPDTDVIPGTQYIAMIQSPKASFEIGLTDARPEEDGFILGFVKDEGIPGKHLAMRVNYRVPAGRRRTAMVLGICLLLAAAALLPVLVYYRRHPERNTRVTLASFVRAFLTPLIVLPAAVLIVMIWPMKLFDHRITDNTLFIIGVVIAAGFLLYCLYAAPDKKDGRTAPDAAKALTLSELKSAMRTKEFFINLSGAVSALLVALLIGFGCEYMNGFYEIQHRAAEKKIAAAFIALTAVLVLSAAAGKAEPKGSGRTAVPLYRSVFSVSAVILLLVLVVFRNGRMWPVALAGMAAALAAALRVSPLKDRWLKIAGDGILLNFAGMVGYCLLHRFYMLFLYTRYSMGFHTVTVTAEYLSVAAAVAFSRFFRKRSRVNSGFAGTVGVYLLLTMSRTGIAAVLLLVFCLVTAVTAAGEGSFGIRIRRAAASAALLAGITICAFPAVFSLQRIVPVIVGEPHLFETEWYEDEVLHGENWNSRYFIRIERFYSLFMNRVLGLPEKQFDYGFNVSLSPDSPEGEGEPGITSARERNAGLEGSLPVRPFRLPGTLVARASEPGGIDGGEEDYSNGRTAIWRSYLKEMNLTGHEEMGVPLENGEIAVHAHNSFIQAAYDFGIPAGVLLLVFVALAMGASLIYYSKDSQDSTDALVPLAATAVFAASGLVEWVFHTCNPVTMFALICLAALAPGGKGSGKPA